MYHASIIEADGSEYVVHSKDPMRVIDYLAWYIQENRSVEVHTNQTNDGEVSHELS